MKKIILFAVSLLFAAGAWAQQTGTQPVTTDNVPIEEYVPKVIIEGKWGTGPGEFGKASRFPLGYFEQYAPSSLAVNSKSETYVLDYVNNRIQKFNKAGVFLLSIPVEGLKAELKGYCVGDTCYEEPPAAGMKYDRAVFGDVEVSGINIVIDSRDTLYYYLKRIKDGKETGEVWEFRKDKLVKKILIPAVEGGVDIRGSGLWISKYPFTYVRTDIGEDYSVSENKKYPRRQLNMAQDQKNAQLGAVEKVGREVVLRRGGENPHILSPMADEEFEGEGSIKDSSVHVLSRKGAEMISNKFDLSGKLLRRKLVRTQPQNGVRDAQENVYQIDSSDAGLQVRQFRLQAVR